MRILQTKSRVILFKATMVYHGCVFEYPIKPWTLVLIFRVALYLTQTFRATLGISLVMICNFQSPLIFWMPNKCSQGESIFGNIAFPTCLRLIDFNPYNHKIHHTHRLCDGPPFLQWQHLRLCDLSCPCKTMKIRTHKAHAYPQVSEYPKVIQKTSPIFSTWVNGLDYPMSWLFLFHELTQWNIQYHSLEAQGCQSG